MLDTARADSAAPAHAAGPPRCSSTLGKVTSTAAWSASTTVTTTTAGQIARTTRQDPPRATASPSAASDSGNRPATATAASSTTLTTSSAASARHTTTATPTSAGPATWHTWFTITSSASALPRPSGADRTSSVRSPPNVPPATPPPTAASTTATSGRPSRSEATRPSSATDSATTTRDSSDLSGRRWKRAPILGAVTASPAACAPTVTAPHAYEPVCSAAVNTTASGTVQTANRVATVATSHHHVRGRASSSR